LLEKWRLEHPHDTPPYPFTPSPTFAHSSIAPPATKTASKILTGPRSDRSGHRRKRRLPCFPPKGKTPWSTGSGNPGFTRHPFERVPTAEQCYLDGGWDGKNSASILARGGAVTPN